MFIRSAFYLIASLVLALDHGPATAQVAPPMTPIPPTQVQTPIPADVPSVDEMALTTKCLNYLNDALGPARNDVRKARCNVTTAHPECGNAIECIPAAEYRRITGQSASTPAGARANPATTPSTPTGPAASTPASTGARTTPASTETTSTTTTDADEKTALSECQTSLNNAQSACATKDEDDGGNSFADSLTAACKDLQTAGMTNGNSKNEQAKACQSAWQSCVQTCGTSADKYTDNDDWSTFNGASRTCSLLQSKSKALLDASTSSQKAATGGANCLSSASESSSTKKDDKTAAADANAQAAACTANPAAAGCTTAPQYAAAEKGQAQFGDPAAKGNLDVADTSGITPSPFGGADGGSGQNTPKVTPMGGGGGGGGARGGGASPSGGGSGSTGGGLMGMVSSAITDIQKGFLGGGAATTPPAPGEDPEHPAPGADGVDPASVGDRSPASLKTTASLKRYLPGGDLWKGLQGPATNPQFHGPDVNLWSRVHDRMIEKCKLGVLFDCQLPK